ncbi:MAG TPA: triose-phosphate isomerase [Chloroflexota bacterium]|nr:triose-phosphate isomerase [Chloroflexota bacterium]
MSSPLSARRPIVAGNWKMNTTIDEGLALVDAIRPLIDDVRSVDRVVCPPFVSLHAISDRLRESEIAVGAQNVYFEQKGAFTGDISAPMLAGLVRYVIVGHSERRTVFGEDDDIVAKKIRAVQAAGLLPILCVGETLAERHWGATESVLRRHVHTALDGLQSVEGLVVAYEPVWAIGTGRAATAEDANEGCRFIRVEIDALFGEEVAQATRIQYGGSVTAENAPEFFAQPDIDGALVGGASLVAESFAGIVKAAAESVA